MRVKSFIAIILSFALFVALTGCGPHVQGTEQAPPEGTRILVDTIGREVEIPVKVDTVAALDSFSSEVMVMTGAGDKMIACTNGAKQDKLLQAIYPALADVTVIQSEGTINAEALLALSPDVIILKYSFYVTQMERDKIEKLGIPYLVTSFDTMEEQIAALEMVGGLLGGAPQSKAQQIAAYYKKTISLAEERSAQIPEEKRIQVYHSCNEVIRTDGDTSLGADWTKAVGLINVSVGKGLILDDDNYYASAEQIFVWDPDAVICNDATAALYLQTNEKWTGLRAVRENQIYNIPIGVTRWGQQNSIEAYFAILWAGVTLYPDYYKDIDLKEEVTTFYKDILGLEVDDETYEMILSGVGIRAAGNQNKTH